MFLFILLLSQISMAGDVVVIRGCKKLVDVKYLDTQVMIYDKNIPSEQVCTTDRCVCVDGINIENSVLVQEFGTHGKYKLIEDADARDNQREVVRRSNAKKLLKEKIEFGTATIDDKVLFLLMEKGIE